MEKKNIDWGNLGFSYMPTDKRYVANYKNGAWDEGTLSDDPMITMSECACVLQYAQTCFEGIKAYTTEDGRIVTFRPDLNAKRMADSARRLQMPVFPADHLHNDIHPAGGGFCPEDQSDPGCNQHASGKRRQKRIRSHSSVRRQQICEKRSHDYGISRAGHKPPPEFPDPKQDQRYIQNQVQRTGLHMGQTVQNHRNAGHP